MALNILTQYPSPVCGTQPPSAVKAFTPTVSTVSANATPANRAGAEGALQQTSAPTKPPAFNHVLNAGIPHTPILPASNWTPSATPVAATALSAVHSTPLFMHAVYSKPLFMSAEKAAAANNAFHTERASKVVDADDVQQNDGVLAKASKTEFRSEVQRSDGLLGHAAASASEEAVDITVDITQADDESDMEASLPVP